jgi:hypothetical protein
LSQEFNSFAGEVEQAVKELKNHRRKGYRIIAGMLLCGVLFALAAQTSVRQWQIVMNVVCAFAACLIPIKILAGIREVTASIERGERALEEHRKVRITGTTEYTK